MWLGQPTLPPRRECIHNHAQVIRRDPPAGDVMPSRLDELLNHIDDLTDAPRG